MSHVQEPERNVGAPFGGGSPAVQSAAESLLAPKHAPTAEKLAAFIAQLQSANRGLPARDAYPDAPWVGYIAAAIGVAQPTLSSPTMSRILKSYAGELGLEVVFRSREPDAITISELPLLEIAPIKTADGEVSGKALVRLQGTVSTLLIRGTQTEDSAAEPLLRAALDGNAFESQPLRDVATALLDVLTRGLDDDGLPIAVAAKIRVRLDRLGWSSATLARAIDGDKDRLKELIGGRRNFTQQDGPLLRQIEPVLGLAVGSLSGPGQFARRGNGAIAVGDYPFAYAHLTTEERARLSVYLPNDFLAKSDTEKESIIARAMAMITAQVTPEAAARRLLQLDGYALRGQLPTDLAEEVEHLLSHHADPQVAFGYSNLNPSWAPATREMRENSLRLFFGFLCHPSRGAARLAPEQVSVAHVASARLMHEFLKFRHARNFKAFGREVMTSEDVSLYEMARTFLRPASGWVAQADALADRLTPIPAVETGAKRQFKKTAGDPGWLLSPANVALAQSDWPAFCAAAVNDYDREIETQNARVAESRDSHAPIRAILESSDPLLAFNVLIRGLRAELAEVRPDSVAAAEIRRDLVLVGIQAQVALRSKTLLLLDWNSNNQGHLRKIDGTWYLAIPRKHFKNKNGPYFMTGRMDAKGVPEYRDYHRPLLDLNGLYSDLDEYLTRSRAALRRERPPCDAVFLVSRVTGQTRLTQGALQQLIKRAFVRHIVFNPLRGSGIVGITGPAGPHSFRHILATGILKKTGRFDLAADAIHDSIEVVIASYATYTARDRQPALLDALRMAFSP